ncbi:ribosome-inactivating family protein [Streptomyces sp. NPDC054786]
MARRRPGPLRSRPHALWHRHGDGGARVHCVRIRGRPPARRTIGRTRPGRLAGVGVLTCEWGVTYQGLPTTTISRSRLREAVLAIFHHDPNTSTHTLETGVQVLAVALAEGARFQAIPAQIAQAIRGRSAWVVGNHADEIRNWDQRSRVVFQARATDPSGDGEVWQQRREYDWNGAHVLLTALDLARRLYLIKPPTRKG